ncbi:MAG: TlpA disulfide reductase family protein [Odoribacter sp.]
MRKFFVLGVSVLLSLTALGQEKEKIEGYIIEGHISGEYNGKVYLTSEDGIHGNQTNIDSCEVVNGNYTFKGPKVDVVTMHFIKSKDGQLTPLFLENGKIRIEGRAESFLWATVVGTVNNDIRRLHDYQVRFVTDSVLYATLIEWGKYGRRDMKFESAEFDRRTKLINNRKLNIEREMVKRYKDDVFAPFIIMFEMVADVSTNELKSLRQSLDSSLNTHPYMKYMDEYIATQSFKEGSVAYNFTIPDVDGNPIELKNYKGKYVLLDFWASWCGPCRKEMPNVVKLYKECKGQDFEIIGISLDGKKSDWVNAIKELGMKWPQCSDLQRWNSTVVRKYNVNAVPTTVLINPEGVVVAIDLRGEKLAAKVKELIGKK